MDIIQRKGLHLAIYIGKSYFFGQGDNVVAVVKTKKGEYIPHGSLNFDGTNNKGWMECFESVKQVGDFVADWFDVFGNTNNVTATIYLGKESVHRSYNGKAIVDVLDKIAGIRDISRIQHFNDIFERGEL